MLEEVGTEDEGKGTKDIEVERGATETFSLVLALVLALDALVPDADIDAVLEIASAAALEDRACAAEAAPTESCNDEDQGVVSGRDTDATGISKSRSRDGGSGRRSVLVIGIGEDAEDEDVNEGDCD